MQKNKLKFLRRGFAKKCPNCGLFPIFSRYVKTHKKCSKCGINFSEYKSDDGPAYCTIFIVGHILIPLILLTEKNFSPPTLIPNDHMANYYISSYPLASSKIKGAFLAFQIFVKDR